MAGAPVRANEDTTKLLLLISWAVMFSCAAFRHGAFQSTAFDLGIFDQALWKLSHGEGPFSTLMGMNIFSDHGAFILYPLSLLYRAVASPYALLAVQSLSLALGAAPLVALARAYGLSAPQQALCALVYLLHPAVLSASLFDFHPETIGVPLIPALFLLALQRRYAAAFVAAAAIMCCKEVLALTVAAIGICLFLRGQRAFGLTLAAISIAWFVFVTQALMPGLPGGAPPNAFLRYSFLGETLPDKLQTILFRPDVVMAHSRPFAASCYVALLFLPCPWVLGRRSAFLLIALAPTVLLNAFSSFDLQRSLRLHYSLPAIPVLGLMAIERLRHSVEFPAWLTPRRAVAWCAACLAVPLLAQNIRQFGLYPVAWAPRGDPLRFEEAVRAVPDGARVLASRHMVPHLSHRAFIHVIDPARHPSQPAGPAPWADYECVVVDTTATEDRGEASASRWAKSSLLDSPDFYVAHESPEAVVFRRR